jgi:hypothetical protein
MKTMLMQIFGGMLAVAVYLAVQALVSEPVKVDKPDPVLACMPSDLGEKSVLWLEPDSNGGLALNCEKHAALGYAMAQIPVPVSKD